MTYYRLIKTMIHSKPEPDPKKYFVSDVRKISFLHYNLNEYYDNSIQCSVIVLLPLCNN